MSARKKVPTMLAADREVYAVLKEACFVSETIWSWSFMDRGWWLIQQHEGSEWAEVRGSQVSEFLAGLRVAEYKVAA